MDISTESVILTAKQYKIEELKQLANSTIFVEAISNLIHSLQAERGASILYIASEGKRFKKTKQEIVAESLILEARFKERLSAEIDSPAACTKKNTRSFH